MHCTSQRLVINIMVLKTGPDQPVPAINLVRLWAKTENSLKIGKIQKPASSTGEPRICMVEPVEIFLLFPSLKLRCLARNLKTNPKHSHALTPKHSHTFMQSRLISSSLPLYLTLMISTLSSLNSSQSQVLCLSASLTHTFQIFFPFHPLGV